MNKKKLVETIIIQMEKDLAALKAAALATLEAATGEESKPENQYDTRALEASYLAGAQANRAAEVEASLNTYRFLELKEFNSKSPIEATALVELDLDGKNLHVFLIPVRGGLTIQFESLNIQVITPKSPLGEALLGLKVGDVAVVEKGDVPLEYEILSVH
jgi:transcription elongation GreA/GreB family factor